VSRERARQSILDAADGFIRDHDVAGFSVDTLAERADVSRRSVFNHFSSLDDVVAQVCTRELSGPVDEILERFRSAPPGEETPEAVYAELAEAIRATDLSAAIAYLAHALAFQSSRIHGQRNVRDVFDLFSKRLFEMASERHPAMPSLDIALMTGTLLHGLVIIATMWLDEHGGAVDQASRARWSALLDHLLAREWAGWPTSRPGQGSG
jgi:AcrR family transcriptional regulator